MDDLGRRAAGGGEVQVRSSGVNRLGKVLGWDGFSEPNAVGGAEKLNTCGMHGVGGYLHDNRFAVPLADLEGGRGVGGKVYVVTLAFAQAGFLNRPQETGRGPVVQSRRGNLGRVLQIYLGGVALIGTDALAVRAEGETLFVALAHQFIELRASECVTGFCAATQKIVDRHPTSCVEHDPGAGRFVAEHEAEEFTNANRVKGHGGEWIRLDGTSGKNGNDGNESSIALAGLAGCFRYGCCAGSVSLRFCDQKSNVGANYADCENEYESCVR